MSLNYLCFIDLRVQAVPMHVVGWGCMLGSGPATVSQPRAVMDTYLSSDSGSGRALSCILASG